MRFRPYTPEDAATIAGWFRDEYTMRRWCANRYGEFPLRPETLAQEYAGQDPSIFLPLMAELDGKTVGHLVFRLEPHRCARLLYVVVDECRRGEGLGRAMMELAVSWGIRELKLRRLTLCVFANNPNARRCYEAVGFRPEPEKNVTVRIMGQSWVCEEMSLELDTQWN